MIRYVYLAGTSGPFDILAYKLRPNFPVNYSIKTHTVENGIIYEMKCQMPFLYGLVFDIQLGEFASNYIISKKEIPIEEVAKKLKGP